MAQYLSPEEFEALYREYRLTIQAIARRIASTDDDLCEELEQVGRIALWRFDPSKARTNLPALIKRHLRNRMIDYIRSTWNRERHEPLFDTDFTADDMWIDETGHVRVARIRGYEEWGDGDGY